jgi:hypothetical protein
VVDERKKIGRILAPGDLEIARGNREIINKYRHNRICVNIAVANGYWDYYDVPLHAGEWERVLVSAIRCGVDPLTRLQLVQRGLLQHRFIFSYKDLRVFPPGTVAALSMMFVKTFHGALICEDDVAIDFINCGTVVSPDGKKIKKIGPLATWQALYIAVKTGNTQWLVAPEGCSAVYRYVMPSSTARAIEKAGLLIQCIFGDLYEVWTD